MATQLKHDESDDVLSDLERVAQYWDRQAVVARTELKRTIALRRARQCRELAVKMARSTNQIKSG